MWSEPNSNTPVETPENSLLTRASFAFEAQVNRMIGAGGIFFWALFGGVCLAAVALLVVALLKF
jgi:hypothetical protein